MTLLLAFLRRWGGHLAIIVTLLLVALSLLVIAVPQEVVSTLPTWLRRSLSALKLLVKAGLLGLAGVGVVSLAICFPIVFRADVSTKDERKNERRMRRIILYSYSFAALSLAASVLPFIIFPHFLPNLYKVMLKSPVGIVLGCSEAEKAKNEVAKETAQGKVTTAPKPGEKKPEKPETSDQKQPQPPAKLGPLPTEIDCDEASEQWVVNIGGMIRPPKDSKDGSLSKQIPGENPPWWPRVRIQGGLVVPLYFIVLSLIGGAVSLTRRVPEYHRRYSIHYVPTADKPRLDRATVREYLAFQIIQFLSAPLLAVVAYYLIAPQSRAGLIALGFTAGFSSEAILLMIRSIVEKISPAREPGPKTGSVSGNIVGRSSEEAPVKGAKVAVVGTNLTVETDQRGHFAIDGVPIGNQVLETTQGDRKGTAKVTIDAGKTSICHIELLPKASPAPDAAKDKGSKE